MGKKKKISFGKCTLPMIEKEFRLKRILGMTELDNWLNVKDIVVSDTEKDIILEIISDSKYRIKLWNEETLKMMFIAPILRMAHFNNNEIGTFADESLEAEFEAFTLSGRVDWLVAKGIAYSEIPYFFLHEYKRSRTENDPDGQLLAAMLTAQALNNNGETLYGIVVTGASWDFFILNGKKYDISESYTATDFDSLVKIVKVLKKTQKIITDIVQKLPK